MMIDILKRGKSDATIKPEEFEENLKVIAYLIAARNYNYSC